MSRALAIALLATVTACGGGGTATPDAAVVHLKCDDPSILVPLRMQILELPDTAVVDRAALLAAVDTAEAAVTAGPPRTAGAALHGPLEAAITAQVSDTTARASLIATAEAAAATLLGPTLACPSTVTVACVPPGGKKLAYGVGVADCVDSMPTVACMPATGANVLPGDSQGTCTASTTDGAQATCGFTIHAVPAGQPAITGCPAAVTKACTGPTTAATLGDPTVDGCGHTPTITTNAPPGGYLVGTTPVDITATTSTGADVCHTSVTITDESAPHITCPAAATIVRTDPATSPTPPAATITDDCDDASATTTSPASLPRGPNVVTYTAHDLADNTASCTATITVRDGFAPTGLRIGWAAVAPDGSTAITLLWDRSTGADAVGYRIERAPASTGPFAAIGSTVGGAETFVDPAVPATGAYYRVITLAGPEMADGGATPPVHGHAVTPDTYDLTGQTVPGIAFATTLYGVVRYPTDLAGGPYPLVVLLHGNHGICRPPGGGDDECATSNDGQCPFGAGYTTTPNAEGMEFQAATLAANGIIAVTISGNAVNCRNDYIPQRTQLLIEHLRRWLAWSTAGGAPFGGTFVGHVDMTKVGLVGHSRGGDAVSSVPTALAATPVPGVTLGAIFAIAPTDFHNADPTGVPYAVLLPSCDGDVSSLDGMQIYDRAVTSGDPTMRFQVFMIGANHNFFSTEWKYDDNGDGAVCDTAVEVGGQAQRGMLAPTLAAWFTETLAGAPLEPYLRAEGDPPLGISALAQADLDLRRSYAAAVRSLIDDFSGPGAPNTNQLGHANTLSGFQAATACAQNGCDGNFDHALSALRLDWSAPTATATFDLGGLDASAYAALSLRVVSRQSGLNDAFAPQSFTIRVTDGAGHMAEVLLADEERVPYLYPTNYLREVLETVRVPLDELVVLNPMLQLGALSSVEILTNAPMHASGAVIVTEVELAE